jgi:putative sterol carrier protein
MPKFGSIEWGQELKKMWEADEILIKLLRGLSTTMIVKVSDKPEMKPLFQRVEDGKLVEVRYAEPNEKAEFTYEAPMEVWKDIMQNKIEPAKAALTGKLKMVGAMTKISKYMKGYMRMMDLQKKVPTEW